MNNFSLLTTEHPQIFPDDSN